LAVGPYQGRNAIQVRVAPDLAYVERDVAGQDFQSYRRLLGSSVVDVREGLLHTGDIVQRAER
jgi:hypothetical protein